MALSGNQGLVFGSESITVGSLEAHVRGITMNSGDHGHFTEITLELIVMGSPQMSDLPQILESVSVKKEIKDRLPFKLTKIHLDGQRIITLED